MSWTASISIHCITLFLLLIKVFKSRRPTHTQMKIKMTIRRLIIAFSEWNKQNALFLRYFHFWLIHFAFVFKSPFRITQFYWVELKSISLYFKKNVHQSTNHINLTSQIWLHDSICCDWCFSRALLVRQINVKMLQFIL